MYKRLPVVKLTKNFFCEPSRENILNFARLYDVQINKYWSNKKIKAILLKKMQELPEKPKN